MSGAAPGKYLKDLSERRRACMRLIKAAGKIGVTERMLQRQMHDLGFASVKILSVLTSDDMIYEERRRRYGGGQQWETWYVWCGKKEVEE